MMNLFVYSYTVKLGIFFTIVWQEINQALTNQPNMMNLFVYSIFTEGWCSWHLLEARVPCFLALPLNVQSIILWISLIASLFVLFEHIHASIMLKSVGN